MNQWINEIFQNSKRVAVPVMTHPGIELTGHRVIEAVTDGRVHYEAIKYLADHYPSFATSTIMDLTVEAEAFGCQINFPEDEVPSVVGRLVSDADSVAALQVPDLQAGRVPEYLKAVRLAVEHITDRPVLAGCIGPFSLAGRLYDMSEIMVAIYTDPEVILQLLDKCTAFILKYCAELKRLGASGVFIAEPAAGLLSNEDCMAYSTVFIRQIVQTLQDDDFAVILHNCGNTGQCTQAMVESERGGRTAFRKRHRYGERPAGMPFQSVGHGKHRSRRNYETGLSGGCQKRNPGLAGGYSFLPELCIVHRM